MSFVPPKTIREKVKDIKENEKDESVEVINSTNFKSSSDDLNPAIGMLFGALCSRWF